MQGLRYYILSLIAVMLLGACADDADVTERDVHFCVRAEWREGRGVSQTRAFADNLLTSETADILYYPEALTIKGSDDVVKFTLTKTGSPCLTHEGYFFYTPSAESIDVSNLGSVKAATEDGEILSCTVSQPSVDHVRFELQHTQALLRFAFKVNEKYDQIRYIKITQIKLNDNDCTLVDKVLNKDNATLIAYAYVDPAEVTISANNTLKCTYNIYDKDARFDGSMDAETLIKHCTRAGVEAENTFILSLLKNSDNQAVTEIKAGYYYDLNITLNPDYLNVLSDHDNKHITIK